MKERPILFSAPMVQALLSGRKTQTRRALRIQPPPGTQRMYPIETVDFSAQTGAWVAEFLNEGRPWTNGEETKCPYGVPGDRLWVRETWKAYLKSCRFNTGGFRAYDPAPSPQTSEVAFRADVLDLSTDLTTWKPSIFMPRWASRLSLENTGVRVQRLQEISEKDAIAEGIEWGQWDAKLPIEGWKMYGGVGTTNDPRLSYRTLWESLNGWGSWDRNPWVWVLEFKLEGEQLC